MLEELSKVIVNSLNGFEYGSLCVFQGFNVCLTACSSVFAVLHKLLFGHQEIPAGCQMSGTAFQRRIYSHSSLRSTNLLICIGIIRKDIQLFSSQQSHLLLFISRPQLSSNLSSKSEVTHCFLPGAVESTNLLLFIGLFYQLFLQLQERLSVSLIELIHAETRLPS